MLEKDHAVFLVFIHYLLDAAVTVTDIITPIWLPRTYPTFRRNQVVSAVYSSATITITVISSCHTI